MDYVIDFLYSYLILAGMFFCLSSQWALNGVGPEINQEPWSPWQKSFAFVVTHLLVSLVWPMALHDMLRAWGKGGK